jgi:hypothetical protein
VTIGMPKAKMEANMSNIIRPTAAPPYTTSLLMSLMVASMSARVSAGGMSVGVSCQNIRFAVGLAGMAGGSVRNLYGEA